MDPSCTIGFYCRTVQDFEKASEEITKVGAGSSQIHPSARPGCGEGKRISLALLSNHSFSGVYPCFSRCQKCSSVLIAAGFPRVRPSRARAVEPTRWHSWSGNVPGSPAELGAPARGSLGSSPALGRAWEGSVWANPNCSLFLLSTRGFLWWEGQGSGLSPTEQVPPSKSVWPPSFPWKNSALASFRSNCNGLFSPCLFQAEGTWIQFSTKNSCCILNMNEILKILIFINKLL